MSDVLDEYRQWQARWPARVWKTHYIGCYVHHHECMIHRLVDEVERLRNGALEGRETVSQPSPEGGENRRDGDTGGVTLTDAEREAVATASRIAGAVGESDVKAALRGLLARHGGCA